MVDIKKTKGGYQVKQDSGDGDDTGMEKSPRTKATAQAKKLKKESAKGHKGDLGGNPKGGDQ